MLIIDQRLSLPILNKNILHFLLNRVHQQHAIVTEHKHHKVGKIIRNWKRKEKRVFGLVWIFDHLSDHQVFIKPGEKDCRILVNGDAITSEVLILESNLRITGRWMITCLILGWVASQRPAGLWIDPSLGFPESQGTRHWWEIIKKNHKNHIKLYYAFKKQYTEIIHIRD